MGSKNNRLTSDMLVRESLERMGQGVTVFDSDLKLVSWNQRFLDLLNFPKELAFEGADFDSFIRHNAKIGEYGIGNVDTQVAERVDRARTFHPHDFERVTSNGETLRVVGSPLPSGGFVTVYTDITEVKARNRILEQRVETRTAQLRLSEERLQLIADEVPAGIAHLDNEMNVLFVNKRFARAYGREPAQIVGKACKDILHAQTLENSSRFFEQARRGAVVDFEMEIMLPNGQRREIRTYLRPERPSDGDVVGFYLLSLDVTRLKAASSALLQSQKMDAIGRMSSGISHDFNNVLQIIMGNLVPLAERLNDRELAEEYLEPAIAASRRGRDLTRRLLSLAKSEPINPRPVDISKLISEMIDLLRSTFPSDIEIEFVDSTHCLFAMVDSAQLEMALLNLFMNARDAMGSRGCLTIAIKQEEMGPGEAEMHRLSVGPYLSISVSDNGIGISQEELERVFEPFFSSKVSSDGTGLGLSMVYGFVKESNGIVFVESKLNVGTTFSILLPHAMSVPSDSENDLMLEAGTSGRASTKPLVLLVEDDEGVRKVVRRQLIELEYPLIEAEDATVALDLSRSIPEIELVLSDVSMPGDMDGLALADILSQEKPRLGIILMSAQRATLKESGKADRYPFLAKPFDKIDLADVLLSVQGKCTKAGEIGSP